MPFKQTVTSNGSFRWTDSANTIGAAGSPSAGSIDAKEVQFGPFHVTTLTLRGAQIAVADADAYGSQKIYDFPEGRILVLGVTSSMRWQVLTDRTNTINGSASLTWGIGTAAADNATIADAMVDLLPKTTKTLTASTTAINAASTAALASSAQFDGTGTAKDAYLNVGFETNTQIDADGTLAAHGTVTICWVDLGDL